MVVAIPARFKRVAEAFEEVTKVRGCQSSSGSERSPAVAVEGGESLRNLSDLVNSFLEKGNYGNFMDDEDDQVDDLDDDERLDSEWKNLVESLLEIVNDDEVMRDIRLEVEEGLRVVGVTSSSPELLEYDFEKEVKFEKKKENN